MGNIFQNWWVMGFIFLHFKDWAKQDYKCNFSAHHFTARDRSQICSNFHSNAPFLWTLHFPDPSAGDIKRKSTRNQWRKRETKERENSAHSDLPQNSSLRCFLWPYGLTHLCCMWNNLAGSARSSGRSRNRWRIRNTSILTTPGSQRDHTRLPSIVPYPRGAAGNPVSFWLLRGARRVNPCSNQTPALSSAYTEGCRATAASPARTFLLLLQTQSSKTAAPFGKKTKQILQGLERALKHLQLTNFCSVKWDKASLAWFTHPRAGMGNRLDEPGTANTY